MKVMFIVCLIVSYIEIACSALPKITEQKPFANKVLKFDRARLHEQAVKESLVSIRQGVPGKIPFWNGHARQFMYAPAFDFKPMQGAVVYRFTALAYGQGWSFEAKEPVASLESIWKKLPDGKKEIQCVPIGAKRGDVLRIRGPSEYPVKLFEKTAGMLPPTFEFPGTSGAQFYLFIVRMPKEYVFEATYPSASLAPIWKELPPGKVVLTVHGITGDGKIIGVSGTKVFERKAVFNGPYHEAAYDYTEAGKRWLQWIVDGPFQGWSKGEAKRLERYPCKYEAAAVEGLTELAILESDPVRKEKLVGMARNAARTLIKGSFPADWSLAFFPPTYNGNEYETVMMSYPATAGKAYLKLYSVTKEKEFLDAAVKIAEVYKRTQLPDGTWHLLMDGRSGDKYQKSVSLLLPFEPIQFLTQLIDEYGKKEYQPVAQSAWKWLEKNILPSFRFEGQFEDTTAGGSSEWNLSHWPACSAAEYLFKHAKNNPEFLVLADEILRFAEDQFVIWEQPPYPEQFTPCALEQYRYMVSIQSGAAQFIDVYMLAYEVTNKELYLAKAVAFANAMTVLLKESGGCFVNTYWVKQKNTNAWAWGDWPNCHVHSASVLIKLGEFLKRHGIRIAVER